MMSMCASYILGFCGLMWCIIYISFCIEHFIIVQCPSLSLVTFSDLQSTLSGNNIATQPSVPSFGYYLHGMSFPSFYFQPLCTVLISKVSPFYTAYRWTVFSIQFVHLCLYTEEFTSAILYVLFMFLNSSIIAFSS